MRDNIGGLEELRMLAEVMKHEVGTPEYEEAKRALDAKWAETNEKERINNGEVDKSRNGSDNSDRINPGIPRENDMPFHGNQSTNKKIHVMTDYHIGEEINKEMRRQGMKPADFARALHRERQTVYDIFKKRHIATDTLAEICRVLNRDFFKELSKVNFDLRENDEDEETAEFKETISALMPEGELHSFPNNYMLAEIVEEFLLSDREKPLVIFFTPHLPGDQRPTLPTRVERLALSLWGEKDEGHVCEFHSLGEPKLDIVRSRCDAGVHKLDSYYLQDDNYATAMRIAIRSAQHAGRHTILYVPILNGSNKMRLGRSGGLIYDDIAEELFEAWKDEAHFVYAPALLPRLTREFYHAYRRMGTIDRLIEHLSKGDDISMDLYNQIIAYDIIQVEEINEVDSTGLSRIKVFYTNSDTLSETARKHLFGNGVNDRPRLSMWLDVRNGYIVDFEYNKRTQPLSSRK